MARAAELCERVGYPPEYAGISNDLCIFYLHRSDLSRALETAEHLLQWGQSHNDIHGRVLGHQEFGEARVARGELAAARPHLEQALELCRSSLDDPAVVWTFRTAISGRTVWGKTLSALALVLCWAGYPEQALAHLAAIDEQVEDEARVVSPPLDLWRRLRVLSFLREPSELIAPAEQMAALSREHRLPQFGAQAAIMRGCAIARWGDPETGRTIISDGLAAYTATEAVIWSCYYRALLAETYQMTNETDEALHILMEALQQAERTGERWYVAELHRRVGEAHRQPAAEAAAHQSFELALAVARDQGAKLWELNAATSYARLLQGQGKPAEAHALLAPVYAWFTEGFDTLPLREAKAVLDELT
jgi:tetratricopeptide (TPR) repeat protein